MARPKNLVPKPKLYTDAAGNWCVSWTCPTTGKTIRRGCRTKSEDKARANVPRILAEASAPKPPAAYTINALIDGYLVDRKKRYHSDSLETNLKPVRTFLGAYTPAELSDATFAAYRQWRTSQPIGGASARYVKVPRLVQDSTAVRELNALRGVISWGRRNPGWRAHIPIGFEVHLPDAERKPRHRWLTREEVERLIAELHYEQGKHLELFVRLSLATAARMSAVLELKWENVRFPRLTPVADDVTDSGTVTVEENGRSMSFRVQLDDAIRIDLGIGHGNKRRGTGVISRTNRILWVCLVEAHTRAKSDYVIERAGHRIKEVDLSNAYLRAGINNPDTPIRDRAGVHTLKHTACSWMVQSGKYSYEAIAKHVGTTAKEIEKTYGHLDPRTHEAISAELSVA